MARAIWNGAISFGLVTIPVQLVSAVRSQRPRFHLLHEKDESPVHYERVCERESKPVPWGEIVKGFEYEKGEYVVLDKDDFKKAALEKSDTIDILSFVGQGDIDSRYFDTPYYLAPGKGGDRAYALLRETVRGSGKVGVAQLILRQSQHLAALTVKDDVFVLTLASPGGRHRGHGFDQDAQRQGAARRRAADGGAAGRRVRGPVEARAIQGSVRRQPGGDHQGEDEGQGGQAAPGCIGPAEPKGEVTDLMERLRATLAANTNAPGKGGAAASAKTTAKAKTKRPAAPPGGGDTAQAPTCGLTRRTSTRAVAVA